MPARSCAAAGEAGGFNAVQKLLTNRDLDAAIWTQLCHLILDTDRWIPREDAPSDCTHAGCLNGDNPGDGFESVKWISAASLAVTVTDGRVLRVDLDPATGRPLRPVTTGAGCWRVDLPSRLTTSGLPFGSQTEHATHAAHHQRRLARVHRSCDVLLSRGA